MRLIATLVVRDELDIVAAHLEYHRALGVDHFLVTDHCSADGTLDILREYQRIGFVTVREERGAGYLQSKWVTAMARRAATEFGADWVLNLDADEFWLPAAGDLKSGLAAVPADTDVFQVKVDNMVPRPAGPGPFWSRMTVRDTRPRNNIGKGQAPKAAHRGHPEVAVINGNHRADAPGFGPLTCRFEFAVLHYPMRSQEQCARKILQGARATDPERTDAPKKMASWAEVLEAHGEAGLGRFYGALVVDGARLAEGLASGRYREERAVERTLERAASGALLPRMLRPGAALA